MVKKQKFTLKHFNQFKLKKLLNFIDQNILFFLASFLLVFIPLWPKIPIFSPIEEYIVRVRLEDFLIFGTAILWFIYFLRGKIKWRSPVFNLVLLYAFISLISTLVAIFILQTIPESPIHISKSFLHYFRYLEYFSLFFIAFSSIKSKKQIYLPIFLWIATVLLISIYGYGQKYFYFPVYSTMNREFSKGIRLVLTEHARVQSTFGGHYDMGAYLVIFLPLTLAFAYFFKNKFIKLILNLSFALGAWLLILSASRMPLAAFLLGSGLVILLTSFYKETVGKKIKSLISKSLGLSIVLFLIFYYFGSSMLMRLNTILSSISITNNLISSGNEIRKNILPDELLDKYLLSPDELSSLLPRGKAPQNSVSTDEIAVISTEDLDVASVADIPPVPFEVELQPDEATDKSAETDRGQDKKKPADVYVDVPDLVEVTTVSATGQRVKIVKEVPRIYSDCALEKELSLCIRQEVLWPQAIMGFLRNPLTGSGFATLTKSSISEFTEADSTDNNYLRTLGEVGLLGFASFYGVIIYILYIATQNMGSKNKLKQYLSIAIFSGSIGLLSNALYIDVFAASKVAQSYWLLCGFYLGFIYLDKHESKIQNKKISKR